MMHDPVKSIIIVFIMMVFAPPPSEPEKTPTVENSSGWFHTMSRALRAPRKIRQRPFPLRQANDRLFNKREQFFENKPGICGCLCAPAFEVGLTCRPIFHLPFQSGMNGHAEHGRNRSLVVKIIQYSFKAHSLHILAVIDEENAHFFGGRNVYG